jgi:hypothetical protein
MRRIWNAANAALVRATTRKEVKATSVSMLHFLLIILALGGIVVLASISRAKLPSVSTRRRHDLAQAAALI